jgi:hypothetical protein
LGAAVSTSFYYSKVLRKGFPNHHSFFKSDNVVMRTTFLKKAERGWAKIEKGVGPKAEKFGSLSLRGRVRCNIAEAICMQYQFLCLNERCFVYFYNRSSPAGSSSLNNTRGVDCMGGLTLD